MVFIYTLVGKTITRIAATIIDYESKRTKLWHVRLRMLVNEVYMSFKNRD